MMFALFRTSGRFRGIYDPVIIVSANGYKGWVYTDALSPKRPVLRVGAGVLFEKTFDSNVKGALFTVQKGTSFVEACKRFASMR